MSAAEYWNLKARVAGFRDWTEHPGVAATVNLALGAVFFLIGFVVAPEKGSGIWGRIGLGLTYYLVGVVVIFLLYVLLVVPIRQREAATARVGELEDELAERDKIEFTLTASHGGAAPNWTDRRTGKVFRGVRALWVEVANHGRVAEFSARIPPTEVSASQLETGETVNVIQVYDVAWEQTVDWRRDLGVGRLRLANVAVGEEGQGTIFWFWTAENVTWNRDEHGVGWRLRPLSPVIEFPLVVTNLTDRKSLTRLCRITFTDEGFESFEFVGREQHG